MEVHTNKLRCTQTNGCAHKQGSSNLPGVDDQCHVTVHVGCKLPERSNDGVLFHEAVIPLRPSYSHHKLQVVQDHMGNVMDVDCM